jgi:hypothetical protein
MGNCILTTELQPQSTMLLGTTSRTRATTARVRLDHIRRMLSASSSTSASGYREPERPAGNAPQIEVLSQGRSRTFTLNRPEALNALSWDMFVTMGKRADVSVSNCCWC